jgi:hypothetical protein
VEIAHTIVGYAILACFGGLAIWALLGFVRNKAPGDRFWNLLAVVQVVIGIQVIVGGILFLSGGRPSTSGPTWLHYIYGALFPALVLGAAHRLARTRFENLPWAVFGLAAFVCFFSAFRALQTGMGWV